MKNNCKNLFCACMTFMSLFPEHNIYAQSVIFPQEKQPGKAKLTTEQNGEFTLSNDLLTAKFSTQDGKLTFAGAPELGLQPGTEIFKIRLGDGTEVLSSEMKL